MITPIPGLSDSAIIEAIHQLQSPAYQKLSIIHASYLEELELEASARKLTLTKNP